MQGTYITLWTPSRAIFAGPSNTHWPGPCDEAPLRARAAMWDHKQTRPRTGVHQLRSLASPAVIPHTYTADNGALVPRQLGSQRIAAKFERGIEHRNHVLRWNLRQNGLHLAQHISTVRSKVLYSALHF